MFKRQVKPSDSSPPKNFATSLELVFFYGVKKFRWISREILRIRFRCRSGIVDEKEKIVRSTWEVGLTDG